MKKLLAVIATAFAFSTSVVSQDKALDDPSGAIAFIQAVSDDTVVAWSDSKLTKADRATAFRSIFREATDINLLARGMLGRHYKTISVEERKSYMAAMRDYIVAEFDKRMEQVGFKTLEVYGTRPASGRRGHIFVLTKIKREKGEPILADWRVRKKKGAFQIVNLDFEGINLMITNRDLFSAKIKSGGIDGLIEWLKRQTNARKH
ncbi:MAG: ABC transporter substrate-binding protein [Kordiimonadaceae bacterium]|nr:ABC transporter substrate-binding protein [Kordiimonadaceae bacterium]